MIKMVMRPMMMTSIMMMKRTRMTMAMMKLHTKMYSNYLRINFVQLLTISSYLSIFYSYRNSSEFKGKLKIGNNSAAEFDTKFIKIVEPLKKSFKNL